MRRAYHPAGIMNSHCNCTAAQVDIRPAICFEAFTFSCEGLADLIELLQFLCQNQMVDPVFIFDFSGRNDGDTGVVF